MIARLWRGTATLANADAYERHFDASVAPALARLAGSRGAWLLRRDADGQAEFLAVTLWDTLDQVRAFAGDDIDAAHVELAARAVLAGFDDVARHFEVVHRS
jgi:heme-degrading monooxygenase HmoA